MLMCPAVVYCSVLCDSVQGYALLYCVGLSCSMLYWAVQCLYCALLCCVQQLDTVLVCAVLGWAVLCYTAFYCELQV